MKKYFFLVLLFFVVSVLVSAPFAGAVSESGVYLTEPMQDQDPEPVDWLYEPGKLSTEPNQAQDPIPADWPDEPGVMPGLLGGKPAEKPLVLIDKSSLQTPQSVTATTINVWYGDSQVFGQKGNPQQWVNILGNVSSPNGVETLSYSLNGGSEKSLSIGPKDISGDPKNNGRLVNDGDFNIEIDYADLINGINTVKIKAVDGAFEVTNKNVALNYTANKTWPGNYDINWGSVSNILDVAQPVDGKWAIQSGKLVIAESYSGYDRLIAFGDMGSAWTDYEVTVPITVKSVDLSDPTQEPGVGVAMRWQGHTAKKSEQPRLDWNRIGAIGWYRWDHDRNTGLQQRGYNWVRESSAKEWELNKTYFLKMSVQSSLDPSDTRAYYRLKFWEQGKSEPGAWDLAGWSASNNSPSGSVMLIAHLAHVEYGNVSVRPLEDLSFSLTTNTTGSGTISVNPPNKTEGFKYADKVTITAQPAPNNYLASWSGDLSVSGEVNPLIFGMTKDMEITANFKQADPGTLTVNIIGEGTVTRNPDKESYAGGELVTLTATPKPGYLFKEWNGTLDDMPNPTSVRIDGNTTVDATFVEAGEASPITDGFNRCELNTSVWDFENPSGNGSVAIDGGVLKLTSPSGLAYNLWNENQDAPRIMEDTKDHDFTVEIKFDSIPQEKNQTLGFLVQEDANNWLRFDIHNNVTSLRLFAGATVNGTSSSKYFAVFDAGDATEIYMRVSRSGDLWTQSYSLDGVNWQSPASSFTHAMTVNSTGIFAANPNGGGPTFMLVADYFKNTAFPIDSSGYLLTTDVIGSGVIEVSPEPDASGRYGCNQQVTLQAIPADTFTGWSGNLSGQQNPTVLTMDGDKSVTASFSVDYFAYLPMVIR